VGHQKKQGLSGLSSGKLFIFTKPYNNGREKTREYRLLIGDIHGSFMLVRFTVYQQRIMVSARDLSNVFPMHCNDFNPKG